MKTSLVRKTEKSEERWTIETGGKEHTVSSETFYGAWGTRAPAKTTRFDSPEKCLEAANALVQEMLTNGYVHAETTLHQACAQGDLALVRELIGTEGLVEAADSKGLLPIHAALGARHIEVVRLLLAQAPQLRDFIDGRGGSLLHYACNMSDAACVGALLDAGVDLARANNQGLPAVFLALAADEKEGDAIVRCLLERGMPADIQGRGEFDGHTPLMMAAAVGRVEACKVLLEHGARVSAKDADGSTPLSLAKDNAQPEVVKLLSSPPKSKPKTKSKPKKPKPKRAGRSKRTSKAKMPSKRSVTKRRG